MHFLCPCSRNGKQARAELCQAQFKLGKVEPAVASCQIDSVDAKE
jgi:hypothetical protein